MPSSNNTPRPSGRGSSEKENHGKNESNAPKNTKRGAASKLGAVVLSRNDVAATGANQPSKRRKTTCLSHIEEYAKMPQKDRLKQEDAIIEHTFASDVMKNKNINFDAVLTYLLDLQKIAHHYGATKSIKVETVIPFSKAIQEVAIAGKNKNKRGQSFVECIDEYLDDNDGSDGSSLATEINKELEQARADAANWKKKCDEAEEQLKKTDGEINRLNNVINQQKSGDADDQSDFSDDDRQNLVKVLEKQLKENKELIAHLNKEIEDLRKELKEKDSSLKLGDVKEEMLELTHGPILMKMFRNFVFVSTKNMKLEALYMEIKSDRVVEFWFKQVFLALTNPPETPRVKKVMMKTENNVYTNGERHTFDTPEFRSIIWRDIGVEVLKKYSQKRNQIAFFVRQRLGTFPSF